MRLRKNKLGQSTESGQIVVEYILLMMIGVVAATLLVSQLVGRRDKDDPDGVLLKTWNKIIIIIGNDLPDCSDQKKFSGDKPICR